MIAATSTSGQLERLHPLKTWQAALADAITDPVELLKLLDLDPTQLPQAQQARLQFPLRVPRGFVARMQRGNPLDPLLLQVLPLASEMDHKDGFTNDPVGDLASRAGAGLLHKYHGRALLVATGACAVHCRYCFRRHFPYAEESAAAQEWRPGLAALRTDTTIDEVILSGGDPLSLSDRRLRLLTTELATIPHIRRLRIHTRYPIVLPERVDGGLLDWLSHVPLQKVVVIHANHAQEIDADVARACRDLAGAGAVVLNQSVLLARVNDSIPALCELSEALFAMQVLPYYLHVLDRVTGAAHFDVDELRARELIRGVADALPGFLVPRLVREVAGATSKTALAPLVPRTL